MAHSADQSPDSWALASHHPVDGVCRPAGRVLVVDDEDGVRQVIVDVLRREGYEVFEASNGASALEWLGHQSFALVITDLVMPLMDGLTFIRTAAQRGYQTAYIVMTGYTAWDAAVEAIKLGAADYLPKPFPLDLLRLVVGRTLAARRLAERARQAEVYEQLAHTDGLTELYNYRFFQQRLSVELNRAQRFNRLVSLIMLDVDHFKAYNDIHGHPAGDLALRAFGRLLRRFSRSYDVVARYGGDEFVIILPETSTGIALEVAERIRTCVETATLAGDPQGASSHLTASLGIANFPEDATRQSELIRKADLALYHAKTCGGNYVSRCDNAHT
jgi:two-component system, cell cycle response regulator